MSRGGFQTMSERVRSQADSSPILVCFGDSLTAGYQVQAETGIPLPDTPYGGFLQEWLGARGRVSVKGVCGETTSDMATRFSRDVLDAVPSHTVILGGTNDLGWGVVPSTIIANLERFYTLALAAGIQPVGVTIPSLRVEGSGAGVLPAWIQSHIHGRLEVNRLVMERCARHHIPCVDLFQATSEGPSCLLAPRFSSDGLHLNTAGYRALARLVWNEVLANQFGACPAEPSEATG